MQQALNALEYTTILALRDRLAQAERQWVLLTKEERINLWREFTGWGDPSFDDNNLMKAIEANLKEKNT
jgi:hypothetical protein